jgi:hypothetical protein
MLIFCKYYKIRTNALIFVIFFPKTNGGILKKVNGKINGGVRL